MVQAGKRTHDLGGGVQVSFNESDLTVTFLRDGEVALELSRGQQESLLVGLSYYPHKALVDKVIHADPTQR